jgi:hypothetical protein
MNKPEAQQLIYNALIAYVDDCAGRDSEEAKQLEQAWNKLTETASRNDFIRAICEYSGDGIAKVLPWVDKNVTIEKPKLTIEVPIAEDELERLQHEDEEFEWNFPTEEDPDLNVTIIVKKES